MAVDLHTAEVIEQAKRLQEEGFTNQNHKDLLDVVQSMYSRLNEVERDLKAANHLLDEEHGDDEILKFAVKKELNKRNEVLKYMAGLSRRRVRISLVDMNGLGSDWDRALQPGEVLTVIIEKAPQ